MKTPDDPFPLSAGAGKANPTLRQITASPLPASSGGETPDVSITLYVATRAEVEKLDTDRFLATFGPKLRKKKLLKLRGNVHFVIDGYDDTSDEIYEIAEVRRYYSRLHELLPCWLFYGHLGFSSLRAVMLCILPNIWMVRSPERILLEISKADTLIFIRQSLPVAARLFKKAGVSIEGANEQLRSTARLLGISEK